MAENKIRVIDFTHVEVEQVDKSIEVLDVSKLFASAMYNVAKTLAVSIACQDLYKSGKCEYTDEIKDAILVCLDRTDASYALRTGIMKAIG